MKNNAINYNFTIEQFFIKVVADYFSLDHLVD